jgi:curli biogenesis system outer membrane secretion channel CsgG
VLFALPHDTTGTIARLELKNTATKFIENGVSGGDNRSTGVTGSIQCVFNVAAGSDIKDALIEELLKQNVFYLLKRKMELS